VGIGFTDTTEGSMSSSATSPAPIAIRLLSQPGNLCVVRAAIERAAVHWGLDAETAGKVVLAVDEALTNIMRHGYKGRDDGPITVLISAINGDDNGGMRVVIEDECPGVDLSNIKSRPIEEVRPGGLGVHILRQVMDSVAFEHRRDVDGVRLTMVKAAGHPQATPAAS